MRDTLILLVFCFVCYPKLLAGQNHAGIGCTVVNAAGAPLNRVPLSLLSPNRDEVDAPVCGGLRDEADDLPRPGIQPAPDYGREPEPAGFLLYLPNLSSAPAVSAAADPGRAG